MKQQLRIVCGPPFTLDGRWVVLGPLMDRKGIVFDPGGQDPLADLRACLHWVRER